MSQNPQEEPRPSDAWRVGLQLILAAAATALIGDASTPVVVMVVLVAFLLFGVVSVVRRQNRSLATGLAVLAGRRRLAAALSIATVLLLVLAAYLVGARKERDANSQVGSRVLMRVVSPDLRRSCTPLENRAVVAAIACFDRKAGVHVRFFQYASAKTMNEAMDALVAASSAPPGGCFTQAIAIGTYNLNGEDAGRLWCDALEEKQRLAWTNDDLLILAKAEQASSEGNSLMQWWSDANTALSPDGLRQPFPDEYERRLLERVPGAFSERCERDGFSLSGSKATVRCVPRRGADYAYYLLFDDRSDLDRHVRTRRKDLGDLSGSCTTGKVEPAVAAYRDGTRFCYDEEDVSWVEWSDDALLIYALARREPTDLARLFGWWRHNAGPS